MSIYIATIVMAVFSMLILIVFVMQNDTMAKQIKRATVFSALLISVGALAECLGIVLDGTGKGFRAIHAAVKFIELSVTPLIPAVFTSALSRQKTLRFVLPFLLLHAIIEFLSIFFGITFFVDENNVYHHRKFYFLYYVAILISSGYLVYAVVQFNHRFQSSSLTSLALISVFVFAGVITQALNSSARIVWLTIAFGMILFYIYYCSVILQTNALTGLLNRRAFENRVRTEKKRVGILFFDVNGFKRVNDTFGHQYGDKCLKSIAEALRYAYGKIGLCYRVGGDEFCVIMNKPAASSENLRAELDRALDKMRAEDGNLPSVAMGYAVFDPEKDKIADVIARADRQMYLDKSRGETGAERP